MFFLSLSACNDHKKQLHEKARKLTATLQSKLITFTQRYVRLIHSQRYIKIQALEKGYLEAIKVKEGHAVKQGDVLFKVRPILCETKTEV